MIPTDNKAGHEMELYVTGAVLSEDPLVDKDERRQPYYSPPDAQIDALLTENATIEHRLLSQQPFDEHSHHHGCTVRRARYSHFFFLLGSLLFVGLASFDVHNERAWMGEDDDDRTPPTQDCRHVELAAPSWYVLVSAVATLCYMLEAGTSVPLVVSLHGGHHHTTCNTKPMFGVAAGLEFAATVIYRDTCPQQSYAVLFVSLHLYLLYALLLLWHQYSSVSCQRTTCEQGNGAATMEPGLVHIVPASTGANGTNYYWRCIGDIMFFLGSCVDAALSYRYDDNASTRAWQLMDRGNVVSSVLWLANAVIAILAADEKADSNELGGRSTAYTMVVMADHDSNYV